MERIQALWRSLGGGLSRTHWAILALMATLVVWSTIALAQRDHEIAELQEEIRQTYRLPLYVSDDGRVIERAHGVAGLRQILAEAQTIQVQNSGFVPLRLVLEDGTVERVSLDIHIFGSRSRPVMEVELLQQPPRIDLRVDH